MAIKNLTPANQIVRTEKVDGGLERIPCCQQFEKTPHDLSRYALAKKGIEFHCLNFNIYRNYILSTMLDIRF